jgi:D-erythronate 2-dehydrogenase
MHILITGANGFVGQALSARLLHERALGPSPLKRLTLLDTSFSARSEDPLVRHHGGSIADAQAVDGAFAEDVDVVFHLASIPGGTAEQHHELARDVNLTGTMLLLERGRAQAQRGAAAPVFVFASTIAVFGSPLPARVDDDTPLRPQMTYGAQKLIGEILVGDFSRRGWVDGRSVRLPGVLARPPARSGLLSAFMSDMIHELGAGRPFTCPTGPAASTWASSIVNVVDNLVHAATLDAAALGARRAFTLPTLCFTFQALVEAIGAVHGIDTSRLVTWKPDGRIESLFGRFPPLTTQAADDAGFRHDGDLQSLVRRSVPQAQR